MHPKILIADDAQLFLEIQKMFLESSDVSICTAMDGLQALDAVQKDMPHLIILDLNMPRMDGARCCEILKQHEVYRHIPIVMVTLSSHEEDLELCRRAGCDDLLQKPLHVGRYLEMVHKYIPSVERRRRRIGFEAPVTIRGSGGSYTGNSKNISMGGILVEAGHLFAVGDRLEVCFTIPVGEGVVCRACGIVAHVRPAGREGGPAGIGISFTDISGGDDFRQTLLHFIKRQ